VSRSAGPLQSLPSSRYAGPETPGWDDSVHQAGAIADTVRYTPAARCSADRQMSVPNDFPSDKGFRNGAPAAEGA
jgi:hypothetical protein